MPAAVLRERANSLLIFVSDKEHSIPSYSYSSLLNRKTRENLYARRFEAVRGRPLLGARIRFAQLFARATGRLHVLNLLHDLLQVVAGRILQRREVDVGLKLLQPQRLADGQHVPVIDIGGGGRSKRPAHTEERLVLRTDRSLEGIALDVDDLGPVIGNHAVDEARG